MIKERSEALALLLLASLATGCWDWSRFDPADASVADGSLDGGDCDCPCGGDTCAAGECVPAHRVVSIALGLHFGCFVREDGALFCLGDNAKGQLGTGDTTSSATPRRALSAGYRLAGGGGDQYVALLAAEGDAASYWGALDDGRPPATSEAAFGRAFATIGAGAEHFCGIDSSGALSCTGSNEYGQLGDGTGTSLDSGFASVTGGPWRQVTAGLWHTCAMSTGGELWCWGANESGQLGLGHEAQQSEPVQVGALDDWADLSAGKDFTCGVRGARVYCWGNVSWSRNGTPPPNLLAPGDPIAASGAPIEGAVEVDAGRVHGCVLTSDGELFCFGNNECGALGAGASDDVYDEAQLVSTAGVSGTRWVAFDAGNHETCATRDDGSLWCWGRGGERMAASMPSTVCTSDPPPSRAPVRVCLE